MENNKPTVSVIVTTYNRDKYLKETIQSILDQTFTDFELIVVDNFSNYNFFEVIESFNDSRIKPFQNQNNGIIAVNRNFGLKHAIGEYVAFCDDDDLWVSKKLELQLNVVENSDADNIVCSTSNYIDSDGRFLKFVKRKVGKSPFYIYINNVITLSSVLVKRSSLLHFDENEIFKAVEDCVLWATLIHNGYHVCYLETPLINYRISGTNYSFNKRYEPIKRIALFSSMMLKYKNVPICYYLRGVFRDLLFFIFYSITKR